jgi:HD-GYP domain-containing protein (c-di-GMP phosphodiesterase class II)
MTVGRPYRDRKSVESAAAELVECAGQQFDPEIVDAFLAVLKEEGKLSSQQVRDLRKRMSGIVTSGT